MVKISEKRKQILEMRKQRRVLSERAKKVRAATKALPKFEIPAIKTGLRILKPKKVPALKVEIKLEKEPKKKRKRKKTRRKRK